MLGTCFCVRLELSVVYCFVVAVVVVLKHPMWTAMWRVGSVHGLSATSVQQRVGLSSACC